MENLILKTDGYKLSHDAQYPPEVETISSYIEARGVTDKTWKEHIFLGLTPFLNLLSKPITEKNILEAADFADNYGVPLRRDIWEHVLNEHGGFLPLKISALPEGSVVPLGTPLIQVESTDPKCRSLGGVMETALLRAIWYPSTVATTSFHCKRTIKNYLLLTGGSLDGIDFMLHDFGARGVSSGESAQLGGMAHLMVFKGSDTLEGVEFLRRNYETNGEFPGFSVPAAEHSTITSWGKDREIDAYRNMLNTYKKPGAIISVVSDSYDIIHACQYLWGGHLRKEVNELADIGARLVIRPDSGDPLTIPIDIVEILMSRFGYTLTTTGHKLLPPHIRVLQGDGITEESLNLILERAMRRGLCAENFVFGMGGGLLQMCNRDTLKFAMKANAVRDRVGAWRDVFKDPTGGSKTSKRGRQWVFKDPTTGKIMCDRRDSFSRIPDVFYASHFDLLKVVYDDGVLVRPESIQNIRARINLEL